VDQDTGDGVCGEKCAALRVILFGFAAGVSAVLSGPGCTTEPELAAAPWIPPEAVAQLSPPPLASTPGQAIDYVTHYVREHPGSDFAVGRGDSMLPLYRDRDVILLDRPALADIKPGQTIVFMSQDGLPVAHILVAHTGGGVMTRGLNNSVCDPDILRDNAYIGVVVKAFRPSRSAILASARPAPQQLAHPTSPEYGARLLRSVMPRREDVDTQLGGQM